VEYPREQIVEALEGTDLVGLTFLTSTFPLAAEIADVCRENAPQLPVVAGGPHASFAPQECFDRMPNLVAVVIGEGEMQFALLVNALVSGKAGQPTPNLGDIPGIAFQSSVAGLSITQVPPPVDVGTLPLPARHLLAPTYDVATVIVNRGCPNQCSFCSRQALFRTVRVRPVTHVLEELSQIQSLPNYQYINLYDNVNMYPDFLPTLCDGMQKYHISLPWGAEIRIDHLKASLAEKMKASRCAGIATGVETANDALLRANGKVQKIAQVRRGLEIAVAADLTVQAYFVLGLPGETVNTFQETLSFIETSPLRPGRDMVNFFPATPYPGSRLVEQKDLLGWTLLNSDYSLWDCHHLVMCPPSLTLEELEPLFAEAQAFEKQFNGEKLPSPL
jgi:radical SAM superfamily enzyme YgiQ (UPF0313 family)